MTDAASIAERFDLAGPVASVAPFAGGHINASWRVSAGGRRYLLQRVNDHVFQRPRLVMENVERVTSHLAAVLAREGVPEAARRTLTLVPTRGGEAYHEDAGGGCWRVYRFIEHTVTHQEAGDPGQAYRAARAFGAFQRRLDAYDGPRLHETIPGFHDTPRRVAALERAVEADPAGRVDAARSEVEAALRHRALAGALLEAFRRGEIPERVVHNDAKMSNVLFDAGTGEALCVVDLDTVMPGLSLYDFGDMARSMVVPVAEDAPGVTRLAVDGDRFEALARGYLEETAGLLTSAERALLVTAARLIIYEQAVRFLTDYLEGDVYYRTARPAHNLDRCRVQLALLEAFTRDEAALRSRADAAARAARNR